MEENQQQANGANEQISKKVFDDMETAHKNKIAQLEEQNTMLKKQVNDYSLILQNINVNQPKDTRTSDDIVKDLLKGVK